MKRLMFTFTLLTFLLIPTYSFGKDAGPAAKAVVPAKVAVPKPEVKVIQKKVPHKAVLASQPTKAEAPASAPTKPEIKVEGVVKLPDKKDIKLTDSDPGVSDMIYGIYTNFKSGKVWDGIALLLMLITFVIGLLKKDIPSKYLPWIAASIGVATSVVSAILGGADWARAVSSGVFQGAAAAGLWSMVGKHILLSRETKVKREQAREFVNGSSTAGTIEEK